jgi:hypothetical protein
VLRESNNAGLLIHGMGRVGKSILAARLADRRPDLTLAVVFGRYDALSVAEAIKDACPEAARSIDAARDVLHDAPGALEGVLRQILEGPCAQVGVGKPLLLVAVYERLGDVRARAVTLGDIARLRAQQGEVEEALRLHQERLAVNRRLSNLEGQASAMWDIAQIELGQDNIGQAAPLIVEAYQICDRINRLEGICIIGMTLGQLLIANDRRDQGLAVLRRSEEDFRRMQRHSEADAVAALITRLGQG